MLGTDLSIKDKYDKTFTSGRCLDFSIYNDVLKLIVAHQNKPYLDCSMHLAFVQKKESVVLRTYFRIVGLCNPRIALQI